MVVMHTVRTSQEFKKTDLVRTEAQIAACEKRLELGAFTVISTRPQLGSQLSGLRTKLRSELRDVEKCEKYLQLDIFINPFANCAHSSGWLA